MLRQLELFGFKSFADKTVFEFAAGITGVVGPNGSGKSNVVDSIKWILGDQSAKSLRGKDMTDVIFNGSSSRTGSQFAEATLVFDNQSRFLPVDMDEVAVGRRLWQSGDSEYLINRNAVRLKDVRDLFVGTGAGAAAYCIIEQGRVDQILQSNAANRRSIFEEAAGISRFKARRTEALRRLERVEQNLQRLTDIVDEVESQVGNVRTQAQRASRFRQVSTELEQLWVGLSADDYRRESLLRTTLQLQMKESHAALATFQQKQSDAEKQLATADAALSEIDEELRTVERRRGELRSRISSLETTVRHQTAREAELHSDVQRLQRQQALMINRVNEAETERNHLDQVLTQERTTFEKRRSVLLSGDEQLTALQSAVAAARDETETVRQQMLQQVRANSAAAAAMGSLRSECQAAEFRSTEAAEQLQNAELRLLELDQALVDLTLSLQQAQEELQQAENLADSLLQDREQLLSEQNHSQQSLAELREQRSGLLARRTVLEDLEDKQEGFGIGVREILRRAEEADAEPWNLICGSIADLLDVDMDNAALLEVSLSGRAQLLVVRKLQPFVEYLNSGRCRITGRVGFISLEDAAPVGHLSGNDAAKTATDSRGGQTVREDLSADEQMSNSMLQMPDVLSAPIDDVFATMSFPETIQVTWVDPRTDSPIIRSVFSQGQGVPPTLFGRPGVVGRADGLARSPRQLPDLAGNLLADTWIVENLNDALRLQAETEGRCRFVTLQGELVENDGSLFAGTVRSESAVLSRKSELRRLRNELHGIEHAIAQRELRLQNLANSIQTTDEELNQRRRLVNDRSSKLHLAQNQLDDRHRLHADVQKRIVVLTMQRDQTAASRVLLQSRIDEALASETYRELALQQLQLQISELEQQQNQRRQELDSAQRERTSANLELTRSEERLLGLQESVERVREDLEQRRLQHQEAERRLGVAAERQRELQLSRLNTSAEISELAVRDDAIAGEIRERTSARNVVRLQRQDATRAETQIREICRQHESRHHELQLQVHGIDHQLKTAADRIRDEYQIDVEDAVRAGSSAIGQWLNRDRDDTTEESEADGMVEHRAGGSASAAVAFTDQCQAILDDPHQYSEMRTEIERRVERLRRQLKKIGHVSTESLDNLIELETRFNRLHAQLKDLEAARDTLRDIVRKINVESRRMFVESFECIRKHFRELFRRLFGGGEADLVLEDPDDVLECAIDVVARPPGKELRSISLLSGGEKTMTAVALLLSIFRSRPSPFCILDEVDAALDDANIGRFVGVLRDFQQSTQFIMITHRKPTMAVTDVLYGVTMEESGISRRLSLRFEDVDDRGNFNPKQSRSARAA